MASSLATAVSELVRASMGADFPKDITEEELDRRITEMIIQEAKQKDIQYNSLGVSAYLPPSIPDVAVPNLNKRFLSSVLRNTDDHNKILLKAQAQAAAEAKAKKEEEEKEQSRARARKVSSSRKHRRDRRQDEWEHGRDGTHHSGRHHRRHKRKERSWERRDHEGPSAGGENDDDLPDFDRSNAGSSKEHHTSRARQDDGFRRSGEDIRASHHRSERKRRDSRSRSHARRSRRRHHAGRSIERQSLERFERRESPISKETLSSETTPILLSPVERNSPSIRARRTSISRLLVRASRSPSPGSNPSSPVSDQRERRLESNNDRRYTTITNVSDSSHSPSRHHHRFRPITRPRSPTPPPAPSTVIARPLSPRSPSSETVFSSKMDKYFTDSYDPRLDAAPLSKKPKVPKDGLIPAEEFEGWDAMLELIKIRREDKAERKRLEVLAGVKESKKKKKKKMDLSWETVEKKRQALSLKEPTIMDIRYDRRGIVREWDMGKADADLL